MRNSTQDTVIETPLRRRRLDSGHSPGGKSFHSQDSEGDRLFTDYDGGYDTAAALREIRNATAVQLSQIGTMSPNTYITQPTQIIQNWAMPNTPDRAGVQVLASSPTPAQNLSPARGFSLGSGQAPSYYGQASPQQQSSAPRRTPSGNVTGPSSAGQSGTNFGRSFAPPGTIFRRPQPWYAADLDDDQGMVYQGNYSDDESQNTRDIKPSVVRNRNAVAPTGDSVSNGQGSAALRFSNIMTSSRYQGSTNPNGVTLGPQSTGMKRSSDLFASSYGGYDRPPKQRRPALPEHYEVVLTINDIQDFGLRNKIARIQQTLPHKTVIAIRDAVMLKKGNENDALDYLIENEPKAPEVDLTLSDGDHDELSLPTTRPARTTTKQKLKEPTKKIADRYGISSQAPKNLAPKPGAPSVQAQREQSPPQLSEKRRRLVRGRKHQSSPVASSPVCIADDTDSGVDARTPDEDKSSPRQKLLGFFNSCSTADLMDMASIDKTKAEHIISCRPFKDLNEVREVKEPAPKSNSKSNRQKRAIGDKVVDVCGTMWLGYQAVDDLVQTCKELRKPITEGMKKWGVDVIGAAKDGEIDLVNLDGANKSPLLRDSGIGTPADVISDDETKKIANQNSALLPQPALMSKDITMKDYQVIGMNWLSLLFDNKLSCILADDMGLGKTCQVIAFMAHLYETEVEGPHLIIVPGSTLENWLREFKMFCPSLHVTSYYGSQPERAAQQEEIKRTKLEDRPYVFITTYDVAAKQDDRKFLATKVQPVCGVFDEGHALKNYNTNKHKELMRIPFKFRLLLTGTPLQNNLTELMSLLNFIMPEVFETHFEALDIIFKHKAKTNEESHDALLSAQRISRARSMMAPFILRRKKEQVLQNLPKKTTRVEYCELSQSQREIYQGLLDKAKNVIARRQKAKETKEFVKETSNVLVNLRKACIHPLLFRRLYTDKDLQKAIRAYLRNPNESHRNFDYCMEDMSLYTDHNIHTFCLDSRNAEYMSSFALDTKPFLDSGKVSTLIRLLKEYKANGDRVLIFSQFTMVLDILEEVLSTSSITFFRIDGSTAIDSRQSLIDAFYADESVTAFMLSTKAGGAGINLAAANKVIIVDSSFNPQDDIQAENRAHRVGQTREVEVVRLVSKGTVEEQILALGQSKVLLDARVAGNEASGEKKAKEGERMVREALFEGLAEGKEGVKEKEKEGAKEEEKKGVGKGEKEEATKEASEEKIKKENADGDDTK